MRLKKFNIIVGHQIFKALGEEPRIRMINLLLQFNELCISDLEIILDYTQSKTSRHLNFLKNAKIVTSKKVEQWTFYSINPEIGEFLKSSFKYMDKDSQLSKDIEVYKIMHSNRALASNKLEERKYRANFI